MKFQSLMLGLGASFALKSVHAASNSNETLYLPIPTDAPKTWVHPGIFVSGPQLDYIAKRIKARENPWTEALDSMLNMSADQHRRPTLGVIRSARIPWRHT
ncbi:hypothetical protein LB505_006092 [Fusarium chuoi]|nr:hypothetical protein LB505_006092 [Fusarium chuoi]